MKRILVLSFILLLSACGGPERTVPTPLLLSSEQMLEKIHAQTEVQNEVVFNALTDERILDLHERAIYAQQKNDYPRAVQLLEQGLLIDNRNPGLLQSRAEIAVQNKAWLEAEQLAMQSFQFGSHMGFLCRRNWLTIYFSRMAQGHNMPETQLAKNMSDCMVLPTARM